MPFPRRHSILLAILLLALACRGPEPTLARFRAALDHATQSNVWTPRDAPKVGALEGFHVLGEEFEVVVYRHGSPALAAAWAKRHGSLRNGSLTLTVFKDVNQVAGTIFMGL
jgi:hypothetical protein